MNSTMATSVSERDNTALTPAQYGKVAEVLLQMIHDRGGCKKHLYLAENSDGSEINGIAWSYIDNFLLYLKNDQTQSAYEYVVQKMELEPGDLKAIHRTPFKKCDELYFFAFQNFVLSFYENLELDHVWKIIETYVIRTSSFQLSFDRSGSLQFLLVPYYLMGYLSSSFAHNYSTISESKSRMLSGWLRRQKSFELEFIYRKTPVRLHPELVRPMELAIDGATFRPNEETFYRSGISDYYSILSHAPTTYGFAVLKGLYLNSGYINLELPLLPDQMPQYYDGRQYRMTEEGYFRAMDDPEGDPLLDSLGEPIHYSKKATLVFDDQGVLLTGVKSGSLSSEMADGRTLILNSEKTRFRIYYDMLMPWQKFVASVAFDLRERILREHGIDITKQNYSEAKGFLRKNYSRQLRTARRQRTSGKKIALFSMLIGALSLFFHKYFPFLLPVAVLSGAGIAGGLGRDIYQGLVRRVENLRQEDTEDYRNREAYLLRKLEDERGRAEKRAGETLSIFNDTIEALKNTSQATGTILAGLEEFSRSNQSNVEAQENLQNVIQEIVELVRNMNEKTNILLDELNGRINDSFNEIYDAVEENNRMTQELIAETHKISESQKVLNEITDQINLLSLNASIEAARAGEQGRGFAVVADEISKLAEMSQSGVKEINLVNENVRYNIDIAYKRNISTVDLLKKVNSNVSEVLKTIHDRIGSLPVEIRNKVDRASDEVENISTSTEELAASIEEITASAQSISQGSKQTIDSIERKKSALI